MRTIPKLLAHWHKRPIAGFALLMVALTAVGGPAVCLLDCWLHDLRAARLDPQGLHHHHGVSNDAAAPDADTSGAEHTRHQSGSDGNTPSALTIAVLLTISLLVAGYSSRRLRHRASLLLSSLAIPPPQRPPRCSMNPAGLAA